MTTDFGDESGEGLFDWLLDIGQEYGENVMNNAAQKFISALKKVKGECDQADPENPEWVQLDLSELAKIENFDQLRAIIDERLSDAGIKHEIYQDSQGNYNLLFTVEDAKQVKTLCSEMMSDTRAALDKAKDTLKLAKEQQTQELETQVQDAQSENLQAREVQAQEMQGQETQKGETPNQEANANNIQDHKKDKGEQSRDERPLDKQCKQAQESASALSTQHKAQEPNRELEFAGNKAK